jgi:WbqC-like protein family
VSETIGKRVAILQSNYIPWKGYFDLIGLVDEFVLLDDVQYTKNDWRNRNRIKTQQGVAWLTIPVEHSGRFGQRIDEVRAAGDRWRLKHWRSIVQSYASAPFFALYRDRLEELYSMSEEQLSVVNRSFLEALCELLGVRTRISASTDYPLVDGKTERLVEICRSLDGSTYLSGPAARDYLDESLFTAAGMSVEYMDYSGYPEYPQLYPPFEHSVSVIDLLVTMGPEAPRYLKVGTAAKAAANG